MIPLHKVPRGLLELLKLRTLGRSPDTISNTAIAVIESTPFYGADMQVAANETSSAAALSRTMTGTAANQGRLIAMAAEVVMGAAAGTQVRIALSYSPGPQYPSVWVASTVITAPVAAASYHLSALLPEPVVFGAGATFTVQVAGDAGGADHVVRRRELFENYAI